MEQVRYEKSTVAPAGPPPRCNTCEQPERDFLPQSGPAEKDFRPM